MIFKSFVDNILIQEVLRIISQGQGENNPQQIQQYSIALTFLFGT